jgi:hypothetical protein
MFLSADEVARSLRGTAGLIGCRPDALRHWHREEPRDDPGDRRQGDVVELKERSAGPALQGERLTVLALPGCLLLLGLATPGLAELYAAAFGVVVLWRVRPRRRRTAIIATGTARNPATIPATAARVTWSLLLGLATPGLAELYAAAFGVVVLWLHARAARAILGLPGPPPGTSW